MTPEKLCEVLESVSFPELSVGEFLEDAAKTIRGLLKENDTLSAEAEQLAKELNEEERDAAWDAAEREVEIATLFRRYLVRLGLPHDPVRLDDPELDALNRLLP